MKPGPNYGVRAEDYHAFDAVSSSYLKRFRACPAAAGLPIETTDAMRLGSAVHSWVLEGEDAFHADFAVLFASDLNKNSNAYKEQRAAWAAEVNGRTVLPSDFKGVPTLDILQGVAASLEAHPMARMLLHAGGRREVSLVWDDSASGLRCKARLDHDPGKACIVDLKTCADVGGFVRQLVSLSYDIQAGHYTTGADACLGGVDTFAFVAVEPAPPYPVRCGFLAPAWLEWAKMEAARLLGLVAECRARESFPAYQIPQHVYTLDNLTPAELLEEWAMPAWR